MEYVIVDMTTRCKISHPRTRVCEYKTETAAKAGLTRIMKYYVDNSHDRTWAELRPAGPFEIMSQSVYKLQVPMKTVVNLMSGKKIDIPSDTPSYCDPSSESYWSM
jgi:hypothetical protein